MKQTRLRLRQVSFLIHFGLHFYASFQAQFVRRDHVCREKRNYLVSSNLSNLRAILSKTNVNHDQNIAWETMATISESISGNFTSELKAKATGIPGKMCANMPMKPMGLLGPQGPNWLNANRPANPVYKASNDGGLINRIGR